MVSPTFGIDIEPDYIKTFYGKYRSLPLNTLAEAIKAWREGKGFVTDTSNMPEKLLLVVSEVIEATEDHRDGKHETYLTESGKPCGFASEIADAFIRLLDITASHGIDIEHEIALKMAFNETRPHKHGKAY
jgi:NTP pyrophosphatase (non-canonical NTP hydrolase)